MIFCNVQSILFIYNPSDNIRFYDQPASVQCELAWERVDLLPSTHVSLDVHTSKVVEKGVTQKSQLCEALVT